MRLFFSFFLDNAAQQALLTAVAKTELETSARRVPDENLHVTLAFIGEVEESRLSSLVELGASQRALRAEIGIQQLAYWPQARVLVAQIHPIPPQLAVLAETLKLAIARTCGLPREEPPWAPHVTLARKVSQPPVFAPMSRIASSVRAFSLLKSERQAGRSVYTVVDTWPLLDESNTRTKSR